MKLVQVCAFILKLHPTGMILSFFFFLLLGWGVGWWCHGGGSLQVHNCVAAGGKVLIPTFALGRAQV